MTHRYAPYYCEENVWWLLRDGLTDGHAVFISNLHGSVALWSQRASPRPDGLTLWDYHVVALGRVDSNWHVFDLDCAAGCPLPIDAWAGATFPFAGAVPEDVDPMFRVVHGDEFLADFRSDRSHMRDDDGWLAPPPPWEALSDDTNLDRYRTMTPDKPGRVLTLDGLLAAFS